MEDRENEPKKELRARAGHGPIPGGLTPDAGIAQSAVAAEDPRVTLLYRIRWREDQLLRQLTALREARVMVESGDYGTFEALRILRLLDQGGLYSNADRL